MSTGFDHLRIERKEDVAVIVLVNVELFDHLLTDEVRQELLRYISQEKPQKLVVSFQELVRCSTEVINALIRAKKEVVSYGGAFRLCLLRQEMRQVFRVLKLEGTVFEIHDTLSGALKSFD